MQPEIPEIVRTSALWARLAAIAGVLGIAIVTFVIARWAGKRFRGKTAFGLQGLERLAGPLSLLTGLGATSIALRHSNRAPPLLRETVEVTAIFGAVWLTARAIDVGWVIDDNYSCRSATTTSAGRSAVRTARRKGWAEVPV